MQRILLLFLIILAILLIAPLFAPYDPMRTDTSLTLHTPDAAHLLGTDHLGRDVLSRVLHGGQRSLFVTISATTASLGIGILLGMLLSAWPVFHRAFTPIITACLALPPLLLALVLLTLWGRGIVPLIGALVLPQVPVVARAMQSAIRPLYAADYVMASNSVGATRIHVLGWHIWPNLVPFVQHYAGVLFSQMLFQAGALSLLGLGGEPGIPDWGAMLADGRTAFLVAPWTALAPGLLMVGCVVVVNWVLRWDG